MTIHTQTSPCIRGWTFVWMQNTHTYKCMLAQNTHSHLFTLTIYHDKKPPQHQGLSNVTNGNECMSSEYSTNQGYCSEYMWNSSYHFQTDALRLKYQQYLWPNPLAQYISLLDANKQFSLQLWSFSQKRVSYVFFFSLLNWDHNYKVAFMLYPHWFDMSL